MPNLSDTYPTDDRVSVFPSGEYAAFVIPGSAPVVVQVVQRLNDASRELMADVYGVPVEQIGNWFATPAYHRAEQLVNRRRPLTIDAGQSWSLTEEDTEALRQAARQALGWTVDEQAAATDDERFGRQDADLGPEPGSTDTDYAACDHVNQRFCALCVDEDSAFARRRFFDGV
jgi:hypothetical protein